MNNLLLNPNHTGIPYQDMNNPSKSTMQTLIDDIIFSARFYIDGKELLTLSNVLEEVMNKYELLVLEDDPDDEENPMIENERLLAIFLKAKSLEGCSIRTLEAYEHQVTRFLEYIQKSFTKITAEDVREYIYFKQNIDKVSNSYADTIRRYLNTTFQWLSDEGYVMGNPMITIKKIRSKKTVKKPYTALEIEKLREYFLNHGSKIIRLRNVAIFELLLSSGVRVNELCGLNRSQVNLEDCSMVVFGKGAKEREVYFNVKAQKALKDYLDNRLDSYPCLFKATKCVGDNCDCRLTVNALERVIREAGNAVGVKAHPHKFRRTFATNLLSKGVPLEQVKTLLGHSNIETTTIYALVDEEQLKWNHKKLMD